MDQTSSILNQIIAAIKVADETAISHQFRLFLIDFILNLRRSHENSKK